jgi:hypothetical protein
MPEPCPYAARSSVLTAALLAAPVAHASATFDRDDAPPSAAQSAASWQLDPQRPLSFVSRRERYLCSLAQR